MAQDYAPVDLFDIDDGELDDLTREQSFTLGVEWCTINRLVQHKGRFQMTVHRANAERLVAMAERHGMHASVDSIDGCWAYLRVRMLNGRGAL